MTYKEIATMIKSVNVPYCYYQFPDGTAQAPPFICFYYTDSDDVYADDKNYQRIVNLNVELYSDEKDFTLETTVETVLTNNGLTYKKYESYIDEEKMWQIAYEMEVLING